MLEKGVFVDTINQKPSEMLKYEAMLQACENFEDVISSTEELEKLFPSLYDFSNWRAQNKTHAPVEKIIEKATNIEVLDPKVSERFWNNIFYHSTVQKSATLKDRLIEMIKANHLLRALKEASESNKEELIKNIANAHFLLPSLLFDENIQFHEDPKEDEDEKPKRILPGSLMQQNLKISKAQLQMEQLNILRKDLRILSNNYHKEYQNEYEAAKENHEENIRPILQKYEEDVEKARSEYCSTVSPEDRKYDPQRSMSTDTGCSFS